MNRTLGVHSEVGQSRRAVIHRLGLELTRLTPANCKGPGVPLPLPYRVTDELMASSGRPGMHTIKAVLVTAPAR